MPEADALRNTPDAGFTLTAELSGFVRLALPMVVSRIGVAALAIVDGVMLARAGAHELAVHGLADSLMGRVLEVSMAAATAGLALAAQARAGGPSKAARVGAVWHNGLLLASGLGIAGFVVGSFGGPILQLLGQPATLVPQAALVMGLIGLSAWPALVGLVCGGLMEAIGQARTVMIAVLLANVANLLLNQWLIFGGAGVPPLGALGAATSTLLVRIGMAALLLGLLWQAGGRPTLAAFRLRRRFDDRAWRAGAEQRQRGAAAGATVGMLALMSLGLPVMAGWLGADVLARATALFLCLAPILVIAWGLGDAAAVRIAAVAGAGGCGPGVARTGWRLMALPAGVLAIAAAALSVAAQPILLLMLGQPALAAQVQPLLALGLLVATGDALSIVLGAMLRSLGVLRGPLLAQAWGSLMLLPLAAALAFGAGWQLPGLLLAQGGIAVARALVLAWMFDRASRQPALATPAPTDRHGGPSLHAPMAAARPRTPET